MKNFVDEGAILELLESTLDHPVHGDGLVDSGDPVRVGFITGVACDSAAAATDLIRVAVKGVIGLPVTGSDGAVQSAVAPGDVLYFDLAGAGVKATQTLTNDAGGDVAPNDTVTIGFPGHTTVYKFVAALTAPAVANEVLIGASAAETLDNLKLAINGDAATLGVKHQCTAHPDVEATTNTDTTQVIAARVTGAAANSVGTTEAAGHVSWGAAAMAGGLDAIGTINKDSAGLKFGVALQAVAIGQIASVPVKIKKTF